MNTGVNKRPEYKFSQPILTENSKDNPPITIHGITIMLELMRIFRGMMHDTGLKEAGLFTLFHIMYVNTKERRPCAAFEVAKLIFDRRNTTYALIRINTLSKLGYIECVGTTSYNSRLWIVTKEGKSLIKRHLGRFKVREVMRYLYTPAMAA